MAQSRPERPLGPVVEVHEGGLAFRVPEHRNVRGPGAAEGPAFYNPAMALARDVSLLVAASDAATHERRAGYRFLDLLAGCGLRGVRTGAALAGSHVVLNDRSAASRELIAGNAERHLAAGSYEVRGHDAARALPDGVHDYADVDPFGTPSPFLPLAFRAVRNGGVLGFAATDTITLCGVFPETCLRRYGARSVRGAMCHEVGLRILLGWVARTASAWDLAATPLLAHSTDHYLRVYVRLREGARRADAALAQVGAMVVDGTTVTGPVWNGPLGDAGFLRDAAGRIEGLATRLEHPEEARKLLALLAAEAELPPGTFSVPEACARVKGEPPRIDAVVETLRGRGFRAERTHLAPTSLRGDFAAADLDEAVRRLQTGGRSSR